MTEPAKGTGFAVREGGIIDPETVHSTALGAMVNWLWVRRHLKIIDTPAEVADRFFREALPRGESVHVVAIEIRETE